MHPLHEGLATEYEEQGVLNWRYPKRKHNFAYANYSTYTFKDCYDERSKELFLKD